MHSYAEDFCCQTAWKRRRNAFAFQDSAALSGGEKTGAGVQILSFASIVEVSRLKIGERVRVIDKSSEFFGLIVIIKDKRVEPKPSPYTVYKVVTEDGLPPKNFPFPSTTLVAEQVRLVRELRQTDKPKPNKDYLLITTVERGKECSNHGRHNYVQVEKFFNTTRDEIAEHIVKQNIYYLTDNNGTLKYRNNLVNYEVVELSKQPDSINKTVMCLYEVEKTELEKRARAANEQLKATLDKLAEFARSKEKGDHNKAECGTFSKCPVCGRNVDPQESIDIEA